MGVVWQVTAVTAIVLAGLNVCFNFYYKIVVAENQAKRLVKLIVFGTSLLFLYAAVVVLTLFFIKTVNYRPFLIQLTSKEFQTSQDPNQ